MRAIIRNELRWALPAALASLLFHLWILGSSGADNLWFFPNQKWLSLTFYLFGPLLLGLATTWGDDLLHTREYRAHRPISARTLFWTRHLIAEGALAVGVVVPLLVHLAGSLLVSKDAALVEPGRLGMHLALGASVLTFYALVVLAATMARSPGGALLLAGASLTAVTMMLFVGLLLFPRGTFVVVPLAAVLVAPLILAAAQRADEQGRDRDLPWSRRAVVVVGPLALLLAMATTSVAVSAWELAMGGLLLDIYPNVAADGPRILLQQYSRHDHRYFEVDEQHRPVAVAGDTLPKLFDPQEGPWRAIDVPTNVSGAFPQRGFRFGGWVYRRVFTHLADGLTGFLSDDGYLHLYQRARHDGQGSDRPWRKAVGKGGARPFSAADRVVSDDGVLAISDGADGALWLLDEDAVGFVRHPLPDGDRLIGVRRRYTRTQVLGPLNGEVIFVGQRGSYAFEGDELRPRAVQGPDPIRMRPLVRVAIDGPTSFTVEVPGPDGLFTHHYRPHTSAEHAVAALLRGGSVLRPLALAVPSTFTSPDWLFKHDSYLLDWGIAAGDWPALGANVALTLALAALTFLRLRSRAMSSERRLWWTLAVLVAGLPGYLCQRLIETDRAWRAMPAAKTPDRQPVLLFKAA